MYTIVNQRQKAVDQLFIAGVSVNHYFSRRNNQVTYLLTYLIPGHLCALARGGSLCYTVSSPAQLCGSGVAHQLMPLLEDTQTNYIHLYVVEPCGH